MKHKTRKEEPIINLPPVTSGPVSQHKPTEIKIADADSDGLTDSNDKCPDEPGPRSNQGCPYSTIDADGDGTPDKIDDCPYIKGLPLMFGCPDTDGDEIRDLEDECPLVAGAKPSGCPDPAKPAKVIVTELENVEFETNLANISFDAIDIIRGAVEMLNENQSSKVMLSGHTDNEGDSMHNMVLSQNRADAVKEQLIKWGIDPVRISTVAYGESMPIRSNSSKFGKAKNRRVEVNILKEK
jgi:outer membrane protein OmpA-like peptidoglycan-associated protein